MKNPNRVRNLIPSVLLLIAYIATYLISLGVGRPMDLLDFIAAAGTLTGVCLLLSWMPWPYYYVLIFFACFAQYLGMMFDFYTLFWWYDIALHFSSGIMLTVLGHYLYTLLARRTSSPQAPVIAVLFSVFFAISCAGVWEIYEFLADTFFGLTAQGVGVEDTMEDIIAGSVSAALCGAGLYLRLRKKR